MHRLFFSLGLALATTLQWGTVWAGSDVVIGRSAASNERVSMDQTDHTDWDALLRKYCDASGMVNYRAWHRARQDRQRLETYLAQLSAADPNRAAAGAAKMAFWINAYNGVTLHGILREYPTTSIRNHTAKVFGYNIWDDLLLPVGDRTYSLNQMEHDVLRKLGDPRIHFAIVCASIGCPPLLNGAYLPQQLDNQLSTNARRFFPSGRSSAMTRRKEPWNSRRFSSGLPRTLARTGRHNFAPSRHFYRISRPRLWPLAGRLA